MTMRDPRIDASIAQAPGFARPILAHIRAVVHDGGGGIGETIKRGMPYFEQDGLICGMAAFTTHCALTFRKGEAASGAIGAMGQFGRLTRLDDLPDDATLRALVERAVAPTRAGARTSAAGKS